MSQTQTVKPPKWYWILGAFALLWNLVGVIAYIQQMTVSPQTLANLTPAEQALYASHPAWAAIAFAIATWGGLAGAILLLVRNRFAAPVFITSFIALAVQMFHSFVIANALSVYGSTALILPAMVAAIAAFLIWFAFAARARGWIR